MRIGIFGGSFDPVHWGHLLLAECCREAAGLDEVWFIPAVVSPHKLDAHPASGEHRAAMLDLATEGNASFHVKRIELERGGVSYTVDTLREIQAWHPQAERFLMLGADAFLEIAAWREPEEIQKLCRPLIVARPGSSAVESSANEIEAWRAQVVQMPQIELSSTEIRQRVARGDSIRYRVPAAVEEYIYDRGLYRA